MTVTDGFLTAHRQAVVSALVAGGVKAVEYTAETVAPPCASVIPGQPYIAWPTAADPDPVPFGHIRVTFLVLLLVNRDSQKQETAAIDRLIVQALEALDEYDTTQVTRPGVTTPIGGSKFIGSVITITITTEEP